MTKGKIALWVLILSLVGSSSCQDKNCQPGFIWNDLFNMCIPEVRRLDPVNIQHGKGYLFTPSKQGQGSIAIGTPGQVVAAGGSSSASAVSFNAADATALNTLTQMLGNAPQGTLKSVDQGKIVNLKSNTEPEKKVETKAAPFMAYAKESETGELDLGMVEEKPKEEIRGESKPVAVKVAPPAPAPVEVKRIQLPPKNVQNQIITTKNNEQVKETKPIEPLFVISRPVSAPTSQQATIVNHPFDFQSIRNRFLRDSLTNFRSPYETPRPVLTYQRFKSY